MTATLAVLVAMVNCPTKARAQDATVDSAHTALMAKDADPDWEVVTVRLSDSSGGDAGFNVNGRGMEIRRKTVEQMLLYGYGVHGSQLLNATDWVRTVRWDAQGFADMPGRPSLVQMYGLVKKLLAERFGLVLHTEQRERDVYALVVAKGGLKMTKSADDPNAAPHESDNENGGQVVVRAHNYSMGELAALLVGNFLDRPAIDLTGITERYDLLLEWTQDEARAPVDGSTPPGLLTAIQEQLGLKLEPVKAPADVLVIDKVEKPGAN